ncbi:hypothetical protein T440DRAFT_24583 [Plenodomus tracheiphilus IPT5]|uniref:Uncharacterized protein n=1 Tax=Plenodomus tracheiphilus IPT5 TaxID=1408161 RepID=A0A6A7BBS5_9PLEO|nr:hypothetical protein T440DRAFT_24583 [Plenodomus tracheiphilus IPT5]
MRSYRSHIGKHWMSPYLAYRVHPRARTPVYRRRPGTMPHSHTTKYEQMVMVPTSLRHHLARRHSRPCITTYGIRPTMADQQTMCPEESSGPW